MGLALLPEAAGERQVKYRKKKKKKSIRVYIIHIFSDILEYSLAILLMTLRS